jgi:hypothetical protein
MDPTLFAALIGRIAVPELMRWLDGLHQAGKVVTEAEALAKLRLDVDEGNAVGKAFLLSHPPAA